ncbi:bifunctional folylpolyglutamate synthase/dihydrofolate synthase, partial [Candidatus Roizmanbacteria bacterium]|nr:bifunctional folylpolyglutamate synthase/dihydrofolate synthase [Candidatus Roizmanbacteria bacterium]
MKIQTFADAKKYLYTFIPRGMKQKFPGDLGLRRAKYLLKLLGNPQNQIKVIHVAGTSGKGSTSYLISILLKALGFRVGFHVSPFIADIRERCQINNNLIPEKEFCKYLNDLIPYIDKVRKVYIDGPTYFEVVTVLAYYIFAKKKVDYAVIETGMGGWYDATNCVTNENKIAVITRIGYDHTSILGETLDKIALQKAMITQEKNTVVSLWQDFRARKVIEKVATKKHSQLFYIKKNVNFKNLITSAGGTSFDFNFLQTDFKNLKVGLIGTYQAENCSLALATVIYLSKKENFQINEKKIRLSLKG